MTRLVPARFVAPNTLFRKSGIRQRQFVLPRQIAHSRIFSSLFSDDSTATRDRARIASAVRRRAYGSMAPHRLRTLMPKGQTDWSDIWALRAVVQGTGHMPIGLLALSFCECLRSVKQSRRLNLSAETGTAVVCVSVCACVCVCE